MDPHRLRAALYVAVSASAFGAMAIFARFAAADGADVVVVLFLRFALAGTLMTVAMMIADRRWPRGRALAVLSGMGGVGYVGQSLCFFSALGHASAGMVALLLYLHPFIVTVMAAVLFRHPLGRVRCACVLAATAGTALTIGGDLHSQPLGLLLGAGAALIYSAYILVGARVLESQSPLAAATVVMLSAAAVLGVLVVLTRPAWPASAAGWMWIGLIALVSTVVAMVLLFAGMRRLGPADAVTLSTLEPVVTFVLAALVLGERVSAQQTVGGVIVIGAVIWLARAGDPGTAQPSIRSSSRSKR
ncbi:MAG: DMT family transporter [Rhodocyclaceae bacterium]|nr:DMT family transporter [Rhodocyclaceae bacterium]